MPQRDHKVQGITASGALPETRMSLQEFRAAHAQQGLQPAGTFDGGANYRVIA